MPNTAFILLLAGVLLIYCEFIWVGKIVFGTAGALLVLTGIAMFARLPHSTLSLLLITAAIACFAFEAFFQTYYVTAILATASLAYGFSKLGVSPQLTYPVNIAFGALSTALLSIAKRGRQNKQETINLPRQPHE